MILTSESIDNLKAKVKNFGGFAFLQVFYGRRHGRLVRHYFLFSVILLGSGLISSGVLEIYFRYRESHENVDRLQQEVARAAAFKTEQFIQQIEAALRTATRSPEIARKGLSEQFQAELTRLLLVTPAIEEAMALDLAGHIRLQASRFRAILPEDKQEMPPQTAFEAAKKSRSFFGPVHFVGGSEPYNSIAVPIERFAGEPMGILWAKVNLKYIWEVIQDIKIGRSGYAYIVTRSGDLLAHPDWSLVLRRQNLAHLHQVRAAFQANLNTAEGESSVSLNLQGRKVFSSHVFIPSLDWAVIIERPLEEAYEPLYASMFRTSILLLIGLGMALLATLLVSRRVIRPLETLRRGVERIRKGNLDTRLDLKTGDEIEILAEEFNEMAAHVRDAYAGLERKVAERTHALKVANEKLEEASQLKSQFLANVNHELRTPVSAIIGYGHLVLRGTEGQISQLQRENLQDLLHNAERLLNQIDSLLEFSKIEAGKMEVHLEPVKVNEVIQGAISIIEPTLNGANVRIIREFSSDLPVVNTDREKLGQILLNLLDNAVKFTERGNIKVAASQQNGSLRLVISDTGIGIPKEELNRIFEEFHRRDSSSTKNYRGTGLGLAIVKKFVNLLGGDVAVESEVDKGSVFTVTLPLDSSTEPHNGPVGTG